MTSFSTPMQGLMLGIMIVLVGLILLCLIYAILSHRFTDKIVAANMIGSLTMNIMIIFAIYIGQSYILDIGLVIAMLSFLSVIVLCRVVTDHIFGQLRHMRDKETEPLSKESIANVGTEYHRVHRITHPERHEASAPNQKHPTDANYSHKKSTHDNNEEAEQ